MSINATEQGPHTPTPNEVRQFFDDTPDAIADRAAVARAAEAAGEHVRSLAEQAADRLKRGLGRTSMPEDRQVGVIHRPTPEELEDF